MALLQSYSPFGSRANLRMTRQVPERSAVPTRRSNSSQEVTLPEALPCRNFFERYPEKVGPMGNVLITDEEELLPWLLVARPVPPEEGKKMGGCILFNPSLGDAPADGPKRRSQFYCITDPDDVVYGRAAYLPRVNEALAVKAKGMSATHSSHSLGITRKADMNSSSSSSTDNITEESGDYTDTSEHSDFPQSFFNTESYCCVYEDAPV